VDDLRAIKGIGPKPLEKMRKYLPSETTLSRKKPATAGAKSKSTAPAAPPSP
jgi:hypothetical protein